jgi:colanic acid/amylovoran biosynthesis glycosyltransferase
MKILFITAQTPWGKGETFIFKEMLELKRQGIDLVIIPRNPPKEVFHKEAKELLENAIWMAMINFRMIASFCLALLTKITLWRILLAIIINSRNPKILIKNLAVFPKAVFIAKIIKKEDIDHIHAHWGSTTATLAYIISRLTGIPWSFTLHRWDIKENNMLKEKVKFAKFVRCISEHGKNELYEIVDGNYRKKIKVVHMGVKPSIGIDEYSKNKEKFTIITPANLVEVKGHRYLIEACEILVNQGIKNFQCIFYGEGPLKEELENLIKEKKLTDFIAMPGAIPHENLLKMYKNREIDMVILPSITTRDGEHEGIPVSLMEAMAYGIPVISTNTGGIPELLYNGAGIIVNEKSPEQLAEAILKVMKSKDLRRELTEREFQRIKENFNIEKNTKILLKLIQELS